VGVITLLAVVLLITLKNNPNAKNNNVLVKIVKQEHEVSNT
jgi:hypothetical protein